MKEETFEVSDHGTVDNSILQEVLAGLSQGQKTLPAKLLYDKRGSEIFEKICLLKEYYPTKAESEILRTYAGEISRLIGGGGLMIEPGSGAGEKIRYLLPHLVDPVGYVPIEISQEILERTTEEIRAEYPYLKVIPIRADFNRNIRLPTEVNEYPGKKSSFSLAPPLEILLPQKRWSFCLVWGK